MCLADSSAEQETVHLYWQFVNHFSLCPVDCLAASSMKQESCSNVHLVSAVTFLWVLHVQLLQHKVKPSRQEKYPAQMASLAILEANSITPFFNVHLPF